MEDNGDERGGKGRGKRSRKGGKDKGRGP